MKKNQLEKLLLDVAMSGGATLKPNGDHLSLNSGYMVSLYGYEKKLNLDSLTVNDVNNYLLLAKKLKAYCGLWIDNNILYLDISIRVNDLKLAKSLGLKNKQLAIFDLKNLESIYLD